MIALNLRYEGNGRFSAADHVSFLSCHEQLEQGEVLSTKFTRPRSVPENRLFHGAISHAWHNQRGGPRFEESEGGWLRLRAWLLCEAGHCEVYVFEPEAISESALRVLRSRNTSTFWTVREGSRMIVMREAKTVRFADVKHPDFQPIKNKVFEMLTQVIVPGSTVEGLMEMAREEPVAA